MFDFHEVLARCFGAPKVEVAPTPCPTISELDALQHSLNQSLDAIRAEIYNQNLPALSNFADKPHPMDDPNYPLSPRLYEARRLALGERINYYASQPT
jgi:hypothetical protein